MRATTRSAFRRKVLLETPDEVALTIASAIDDPSDLLRLAVAVRRFRAKTVRDPEHGSRLATTAAAADDAGPPEMWSLANEAARRWVRACSAEEQARVPRKQRLSAYYVKTYSWLELMYEVIQLRNWDVEDVAFSRAHSAMTLTEDDNVATMGFATMGLGVDEPGAAASGVPMRAGRHFAEFTVLESSSTLWGSGEMMFGVISADWDVEYYGGDSDIPVYNTPLRDAYGQ